MAKRTPTPEPVVEAQAARFEPPPPPSRSPLTSLGWTLRDYAKRTWDNSGEDNVLFLAGGIAFNLILAAVPFILLLVNGVAYLLPIFAHNVAVDSPTQVAEYLDRLLPTHNHGEASSIDHLIFDIVKTRGQIGLFAANLLVSTYVMLATKNGAAALVEVGLRKDVMGNVEYWIGRLLAFSFVALMFFALYKYLPIRRVRAKTAWVASLFSSIAFEAARSIFSLYTSTFNPASLYTRTIAAIIIGVVWVYYAALIFILGGEV